MSNADVLRQRVRERLDQQRTLVQALLRLKEQLKGSLFARYAECGKESCACRQGARHGPYYVLSTRSAGKGGFAYLDKGKALAAKALLGRHREFQSGLRRLRKLNGEIVVLLRRYQTAMAKQGGRKIGVSAHA